MKQITRTPIYVAINLAGLMSHKQIFTNNITKRKIGRKKTFFGKTQNKNDDMNFRFNPDCWI
jgi:hypothetical protein